MGGLPGVVLTNGFVCWAGRVHGLCRDPRITDAAPLWGSVLFDVCWSSRFRELLALDEKQYQRTVGIEFLDVAHGVVNFVLLGFLFSRSHSCICRTVGTWGLLEYAFGTAKSWLRLRTASSVIAELPGS